MSKLNAEQRAALQSARAKNRKLVTALGNAGLAGVSVPKNIVTKIQAIENYFASVLDAKPKADTEAETSEAVAVAA